MSHSTFKGRRLISLQAYRMMKSREQRAGSVEHSAINHAKTNHESTKIGKHEKGPGFLYNFFFFRDFVPRQINGGQA
jgi:hypothetical protein